MTNTRKQLIFLELYSLRYKESNSRKSQKESEYRLNWILGLHKLYTPKVKVDKIDMREIYRYGIGSKRNLEDFWKFMGFDKKTQVTKNVCDKIWKEQLRRIPWNEGKDPFS